MELATKTALGGTVGDTIAGEQLSVIAVQADGVYILRPNWNDPSLPTEFDDIGDFCYSIPDATRGRYQILGQTETNLPLLAAYLLANPVVGFVVTGNDVKMAGWGGRYLGAAGGLGLSAQMGQLYQSENKSHTHNVANSGSRTNGSFNVAGVEGQSGLDWPLRSTSSATANQLATSPTGTSYARPETIVMPLCIVGDRP